jgi:hypothetical protein
MKIVYLTQLRDMEVREAPKPELKRPEDVLVRIDRWASAVPMFITIPRVASEPSVSNILKRWVMNAPGP